jgi:hypothetical protein
MPMSDRCTGSLRQRLSAGDGNRFQHKASKEALSRLPKLDIPELREEWCRLYKTDASPHLSRELLIPAVAYRVHEVALGGLRPEQSSSIPKFAKSPSSTKGL